MAIGKRRSGGGRGIGAESDAAKNARRQQAISLAQKSATENAAANRQLDTARAQAAPATLMHAPAPSRLGERLANERAMQEARFNEAARQRDWQGQQSALDRTWRSGESAAERTWRSGEAQLGRDEAAKERDWKGGQNQSERDLRERMSNASLQNQFLINAANQASADRRAREALRSSERIKEMELRGDAAKNDYNLALQELKNRGAIDLQHEKGETALDLADANNAAKIALGDQKGLYAAGRDAAKYAHELELRGIDNEEWRRRQEFTDRIKSGQEDRQDARRRFAEDEKLVNAGTHEWGYTPEQQQTIDDLWHTYDEAIENGEADEDDLRELEAQIQSKIDAMPKRAVRRTDSRSVFNENTYTDDAGRIFAKDGSRLLFDPEANAQKRQDALQKRMDSYELSLRKPYTVTEMVKDDLHDEPQPQKRTVMRSEEEIEAMMRRKFPDAYPSSDEGAQNPNGFSNEDWAWITEQFNAGNLTDMELRSLGLTVVNGALVPIDYGAEAGSAAPARTNAPAPSASAPSTATAGTGTVNLNAPATTADERRNKWAARARR